MKDKKMYILLVISILFAVVGVSLAFFSLNIIGNEKAKDTKITTGDLELVFTDDNEVSLDGAMPGDSITKTISVKNTGTKEVSYNIVWQELLNEITNNELVIDGTCKNLNSSNTEDGECSAISKKAVKEGNITSNIPIKPGYTQEYEVKITFIDTGKLQNYNKNKSFKGKLGLTESSAKTVYCTYDGELTQGAEYVNGQYTYRYKQEKDLTMTMEWTNTTDEGWGVTITDATNTNAVTSNLCTYINNKPVISMAYMFAGSKATSIDLTAFNTSNVINMAHMFSNSQTTVLNLNSFDTSKVLSMNDMFSNSQVTELDLNNFNTSKVIDMGFMFETTQATAIDLSNFDTSNVGNMERMFRKSKIAKLDLSNFDTSNVGSMGWMFNGAQATTLDLSSFDTSNVVDMWLMFADSQATELDLSSFDTSKVTNMNDMFYGSKNLKKIYTSDKFNTNNVTSSNSMFGNCTSLIGGKGTTYDANHIDKEYAHIDGGTSNPGYFTDIADKPSTFETDDWATIVSSVRAGNTRGYKVGETKEIDLGTTYGTHTLRVANTSTPSECSTEGFSQTACGFVLEFADIITGHNMNDIDTNVGGWPAMTMRTFVNNDIYNAIPSEIKNAIIDTTVVSSHGKSDTENFTSTDKLYLLGQAEVWAQESSYTSNNDTAKDATRQLDYYKKLGVTTSSYSGAIKKNKDIGAWWLRSAKGIGFYYSDDTGYYGSTNPNFPIGVSPAFRIG